ncbi:DUF2202 domain-containing protein [uncultured Draconibacterium sp.]|uniref:DUF2202 domain-containing protein n=1 Tax=uncultured Draconibacterium sp. TaxID=1573823 RepID=UPI0032179311
MKFRNLFFILSVLAFYCIVSACSNIAPNEALETNEKSGNASSQVDLSDDEIEGIVFMREEEKLARDVYLQLGDLFPHNTFENIAESEQSHTDAILRLINFYTLDDPALGNDIGEFENEELQQLHDFLMALGSMELDSALVVGAIIEETDILDIQELKDLTDVKNIDQVYGNLLDGSENHLRAFVLALSNEGINYIPRFLDQERFDEIIGNN